MNNLLKIIVLLLSGLLYSQHLIAPHVIMSISDNNILKGSYEDKYFVNAENFKGNLKPQKKIDNAYFFYIKDKNYHAIDKATNDVVNVFFELVNSKKIEANSYIRISFLERESGKEMNIYIKTKADILFGETLNLKNISFIEGTFFYDMCKTSNNSYQLLTF